MPVLPGDYLGSEEEFLPGPGVGIVRGELRAAVVGEVHKEDGSVKVEGKLKDSLKPGDVVLARVEEIYEKQSVVRIASHKHFYPSYGIIPIDKMAPFYVKSIREDVMKKGDILLAKVIAKGKDGTYVLSIRDADLGVAIAFCSRCHRPMKRTGKAFFCPHCVRLEKRKIPLTWSDLSYLYSLF